jgi:AcrR family transcriptional regulator
MMLSLFQSPNNASEIVPGTPAWWQSRKDSDSTLSNCSASVGRPRVPRDKFVGEAVKIIDELGIEGLNLRALALRTGSGTATLYRHFANKDEILVYAVDKILGEGLVGSRHLTSSDWRLSCRVIAELAYLRYAQHPNFLPLLTAQVPVGPNAVQKRERALNLLLSQGLSAQLAAKTYSSIMHFVLGHAIQFNDKDAFSSERSGEIQRFYRSLNEGKYPSVVAVADHLPMISDEEEFEFGLNSLIRGLEPLVSKLS